MPLVIVGPMKMPLQTGPIQDMFLKRHHIACDSWAVPASVKALQDKAGLTDAEKASILQAYKSHLEREKTERGYIQSDLVVLNPSTPGLAEALAKFDKPHYHDDDEVRYIFAGEGVFGFEPANDSPFTIKVLAGDYIIVPKGTYHWFTLTEARTIKAIRLFKDASGWAPHYKQAIG